MKKVIGLTLVAGVLASCGLSITKVPITGDAASLGLRGKPMTVSLLKNTVRPQSGTGGSFVVVSTSDPFADPTDLAQYTNNIKEWIIKNLGFNGTATITPGTGAATDCPATVTLSDIGVKVKVTSGQNNKEFSLLPSASSLTLSETATNCTYSFSPTALALSITINGADLVALIGLFTDGASNTASASVKMTAAELTGPNNLTLTWGDATAEIGVGL